MREKRQVKTRTTEGPIEGCKHKLKYLYVKSNNRRTNRGTNS